MDSPPTPDRRWIRAAKRFLRHVLRFDALRAFAIAILALGVVLWVGADKPAGEAALVVIGTLVSYILLPDQPQRFWRVRASELAETVPPSDLRTAGRETARALAIQTGGTINPACSSLLWNDAVERVSHAVSNPRRVILDMDYRIAVTKEEHRQLVRATITSKRCWPGAGTVFFSFCSDVASLGQEFASEGSFAREIVELEPDEDMDAWEHRVSMYPVSLVIDGKNVDSIGRKTLTISGGARAHRLLFDVSETPITDAYTTLQSVSEFHQSPHDRTFSVKFSTYFCVGSTQLSLEVADPTVLIHANDFMLDPSLDIHFFHQYGLASHRVVVQTKGNSVLHPGSGVVFSWEPGELLAPVPAALDNRLPEGSPLPVEVALPTVLVPTAARDEPLVPISGVRCIDAYHRLGLLEVPRELQARKEVVYRLNDARIRLPNGFDFIVLDGWRAESLQARILEHYRHVMSGAVDGYVADPQSTAMRPAHMVGGAVDLTLAYQGRPLALGSLYDDFTLAAHLHAYEATDSTVRRLRRLMGEALLGAGFAPYPFEWWHWSYGDDVWAVFSGNDALYDLVQVEPR